MDHKTIHYYSQNPHTIADRYDAVAPHIRQILMKAFTPGMRVLDVGAGSGRDMTILLELGCDAYGVEPCSPLRQTAVQRHPQLANRLIAGQLPQLGNPFNGGFDGVLCSAVLRHLPQAVMPDAAVALRDVLNTNGKLLITLPMNREQLDAQDRDPSGRLYTPLSPDYLQALYEQVGFSLVEIFVTGDALRQAGYEWCVFLFQREQ